MATADMPAMLLNPDPPHTRATCMIPTTASEELYSIEYDTGVARMDRLWIESITMVD